MNRNGSEACPTSEAISVGILGTGIALPERVLTNQDLEQMVDTSDEWIVSRTGISERRIAAPHEATSDLAVGAAKAALAAAGVEPEELDMIIVATITPDRVFPASACIVQAQLGAVRAAAFDLAAGCSGFVYALAVGRSLAAGGSKRVLVIGADTLSRFTDYSDRSTCVLFGDGAGAAVLGPVEDGYGIVAADLGADGSGADLLMLPAGGSRLPASHTTIEARQHFIQMQGNEVFKFAVRVMGESTQRVLAQAGVAAEDVAWFVPHQANTRIIKAAGARLGISPERVFVNVQRYGNTSAASVILAFHELWQTGALERDDYIVLVGFGAGLTWSAALVRWQGGVSE